jgi:hypothetical protein
MADIYTAQLLDAGQGRSGFRRTGILVCRIEDYTEAAAGYPAQFIEDEATWIEVFKRYPKSQVIRLPDLRVPFSEIRHYRKWESRRQNDRL